MPVDTNLSSLVINKLTTAQYQELVENDQVNENELYLTTDSSYPTEQEMNLALAGKQDVLTAGTGIDITNNVISSTQTSAEWGNIAGTLSDQIDLKNELDGKQAILTAGNNIIIENITEGKKADTTKYYSSYAGTAVDDGYGNITILQGLGKDNKYLRTQQAFGNGYNLSSFTNPYSTSVVGLQIKFKLLELPIVDDTFSSLFGGAYANFPKTNIKVSYNVTNDTLTLTHEYYETRDSVADVKGTYIITNASTNLLNQWHTFKLYKDNGVWHINVDNLGTETVNNNGLTLGVNSWWYFFICNAYSLNNNQSDTNGYFSCNLDLNGTGLFDQYNSITFGLTKGKNIIGSVISAVVPQTTIDNITITENVSNELQASAVMNARTGADALPIWQGTEQEWTNGVGTDWYNWKNTEYTPDFSTTGTVSINDRIATNTYGNTGYIYTSKTFSQPTKKLSCTVRLKYLSNYNGSEMPLCGFYSTSGSNLGVAALCLSSASTVFRWTIPNLSYTITASPNFSQLTSGDYLYMKAEITDAGVTTYYSLNGEDWTTSHSVTLIGLLITPVYSNQYLILGSTNGWNYEIDLSKVNLSIDNSTVWTPYTETSAEVYTLEATPTTASTVYSEPNTTSALTITSVGTGTITLSDNNTYTYNQSGDQTTYQSIGEAHPTWLCNINGVGVKIGTTMIANKADISEYLKKHQIDTNGNYTSEFEYHTANSTEPETDVTVRYNDYFGSLRCSSVGVSLVGQARYGAHITQRGEYFVTNTPTRSGYDSYTDGLIMTKGYLVNNYPDNSSLVYNNNNDKYFLEVKGIKNSEYTDSSTTLKIWEGNSTEYTEDQQSKTYYCWREIFEGVNYDFYTSTATPQVGDMAAYKSPNGNEYQITATDGSTYIELFDGDDHADRYSEGDTTVAATIDANTLCLIEGEGVKRNGVDIATKITLDNVPTQGSTNGITSGAVYSVLGDLETALHNLNSGTYGTDGFQVQLLTENIVNSGPLESEDDVESDTTDMFNEILGSGE